MEAEALTAMLSRSVLGTKTFLVFDFTDFSVIGGWNNVYDFGKRIMALAAFIAFAAALVPLWSPGQTALDYRLMQHENEIAALQSTVRDMPSQIAVINQKIDNLQTKQKDTSDSLERIQTCAFLSTVGVLGFVCSWLFNVFGAKVVGKRRDTQT